MGIKIALLLTLTICMTYTPLPLITVGISPHLMSFRAKFSNPCEERITKRKRQAKGTSAAQFANLAKAAQSFASANTASVPSRLASMHRPVKT